MFYTIMKVIGIIRVMMMIRDISTKLSSQSIWGSITSALHVRVAADHSPSSIAMISYVLYDMIFYIRVYTSIRERTCKYDETPLCSFPCGKKNIYLLLMQQLYLHIFIVLFLWHEAAAAAAVATTQLLFYFWDSLFLSALIELCNARSYYI